MKIRVDFRENYEPEIIDDPSRPSYQLDVEEPQPMPENAVEI